MLQCESKYGQTRDVVSWKHHVAPLRVCEQAPCHDKGDKGDEGEVQSTFATKKGARGRCDFGRVSRLVLAISQLSASKLIV
jgi:hypothetical protein